MMRPSAPAISACTKAGAASQLAPVHRQPQEPISPAEVAHRSCSACLLGHIAMKLPRKLRWDPDKEQFIDDAEANAMLSRPSASPTAPITSRPECTAGIFAGKRTQASCLRRTRKAGTGTSCPQAGYTRTRFSKKRPSWNGFPLIPAAVNF